MNGGTVDNDAVVTASVSGNNVSLTIVGAGTATITLNKDATDNYTAADEVTFGITVAQGNADYHRSASTDLWLWLQ